MKSVLTIAGSDSSGGAGIQADIKSMSANGVFAMSVITAITAQNTMGVFKIEDVSPEMIKSQIEVIFEDIEVSAIKIGMVSKIESIKAISESLRNIKDLPSVVLDPVMISTSGFKLLSEDAKEMLIKELFPLAEVITPNLPEAEEILMRKIRTLKEMEEAAKDLLKFGAKSILIKGGHLENDATDLLYDGKEFTYFRQKKILSNNTHGTGCTLSSAIAANIAKGKSMTESVRLGKEYITGAIKNGFNIGHGAGPTNHFYKGIE